MGYKGYIAEIPMGKEGMVQFENRLLASSTQLFDASGITLEDRYVRKEAGVTSFDAAGVATAADFRGTGIVSQTGIYSAALVSVLASGGTPAANGVFISANATSAGMGLTVGAGGFGIGILVVVTVTYADGPPGPPKHVNSITDSRGNTYVRLKDAGFQASSHTELWASKLTTGLLAADVITINLSASVNVCAGAIGFTNATTTVENSTSTNIALFGPSSNPNMVLPTSTTLPLLYLCGEGLGFGGAPTSNNFAPPSGWTEAGEFSGSGDPDIALNYRVETSAPIVIALLDYYSGLRILSGGTFKAATSQGGTTVTGSGSTLWASGTEAQRIFNGDTILIYNGTTAEAHVVQSVGGDTTLTTTEAWSTAFAATDYVVIRGSRLLTATLGGNIFKERNGNTDDITLKSGLSQAARPGKFILCGKEDGSLNRKVMYINGYDVPQGLVDDGATMASISGPAADWDGTVTNVGARPWTGTFHNNRVALACPKGKDPHRIYLSDPANHGDFATVATTFTQRVESAIGEEIWGLASFQGVLWVWKYPVGIFYLDDGDFDITNWRIRTKSIALGCAPSPYAVCPMDDDVLFLSAAGTFHLLSAVDTLGGVHAGDISAHLGLNPWLRNNVNLARLNQTLSVWYPHKRVALFSVPGAGSKVNNLLLKFDASGVEFGEPLKFSYSFQNTPDALALKKDSDGVWKPIIGESTVVKLLDRVARNKDGASYTASIQTPHLDMAHMDGELPRGSTSLRNVKKIWDQLELIMEPSTARLTVDVYIDGILRQTMLFDASQRRYRQTLHVGDGHTISIKVSTTDAVATAGDPDFKLLSMLVYFRPGEETA